MVFPIGMQQRNQLIDEDSENKYYGVDYRVDIKNSNDSKAILANHIRKNTRCLDVGCGVGYLGEALSKYKNTETYGIELDKKAVEYARKDEKYVDVYNFSVTERKGKEFNRFADSKLKFDYIVFADILEHVILPEDVILFFSNYLKPGGKILVSLPNVAHFDIIRGLTNKKFNYGHSGLLDNTHLRFFTKSSFKQFVGQMNDVFGQNFAVKEIGKTVAVPDLEPYSHLYKILDQDGEACVLQFIYEISIDKKKRETAKEVREIQYFEEIEGLLEQKDMLEEKIEALEHELSDVYSSISWKMTKPLRDGAAVFKKVNK